MIAILYQVSEPSHRLAGRWVPVLKDYGVPWIGITEDMGWALRFIPTGCPWKPTNPATAYRLLGEMLEVMSGRRRRGWLEQGKADAARIMESLREKNHWKS